MFELLNTYCMAFLEFTKSNPVAAGVVSLYGLGCITFFLKIVPLKIWNFIKRQCTTTLSLNSCDNIYHEFLEWVSEHNMHSFVRNLNFDNKGAWSEGIPMINIGYGKTMFFFKKRLFVMYRKKDDAAQTIQVKESITIIVVARNHQIFSDLFELIKKKEEQETTLKVHLWSNTNNAWGASKHQTRRSIDTVIIEKHKKDRILNSVDDFVDKKEWYISNGVSYNLGLLFYGPSGTGKTSLIKALASHYDKHLYVLSLNGMSDKLLEKALSDIPYNSIVAIEDIDTAKLGNRDLNPTEIDGESIENLISGLSLGGVLNALDGITSTEGRILIATTNSIESLDNALIREGRFDVKINIGYMTDDTMREYLSRFYDDDFSQCKVKNNIPPCKVQRLVFENRNDSSKVLKEICL